MTKYERAIYQLVNQSHSHSTAEEIHAALRERYPTVALATVYNNLNKLWQAGLIRRLSLEGEPDRYDWTERHDHLVCRRCGRLSDVRFDDLTAPLRQQLGEEFLFYDLKVFYLCPDCRKEALEDSGEKQENSSGGKPER